MVEFRKLISFGKTSYVMSIPKSWITKNNLKKGDLISLEEKDGGIMLSPKADENSGRLQEETVIRTDKKDINRIKRETTSAYINNYNPIHIVGKDITEKAQDIRKALGDLIALEVMEQNSEKITAKDFLNMDKISINSSIKKMDMITRSMMADSKSIQGDQDYQSIYHRDEDVNRLSFLIYRAIKYALKNPGTLRIYDTDSNELIHFWFVATNIEKIADTAKRVARHLKSMDPKSKDFKKLIEIYSIVEKRYLDTMKSFYNKNKECSYELAKTKRDILQDLNGFSEKNKKNWHMQKIIYKMQQIVADSHDIARTTYLFLDK